MKSRKTTDFANFQRKHEEDDKEGEENKLKNPRVQSSNESYSSKS